MTKLAQQLAQSRNFWFWTTLLLVSWVLSTYGRDLAKAVDAKWLIKFPAAWRIPMKGEISAAMSWLVEDAHFGLFTVTEATRSITWLLEQPYQLVLSLFASGFYQGVGQDAVLVFPALSWVFVIILVMAIGHYAKDWWLSSLVGIAFLYLAVFGQWDSSMVTLASIAIAVPIGVWGGILLGIAAYKWWIVELALRPLLDLMQTIPVFAYLVPILFLFGFGPVSALVATIIYAMPPMVRITTLALKSVPTELKEFSLMAGCTPRQTLWKVLIPSAKPTLMVGVNQVIMLSLNMVIIASMIGAGGLGYDVLASLRRLDIGGGLEAGVAIVVLAIALDRVSQAFALQRSPDRPLYAGNSTTLRIMNYPRTLIVLLSGGAIFAIGSFVPQMQTFPEAYELTTGAIWEDVIRTINVNFFDQLEAIKTTLLSVFLVPVKRFLGGIPWIWGLLAVSLIGWRVGGWKVCLLAFLLTAFIIVNGLWAKAMTTVYLCGISVLIACVIGIPVGILSALNSRVDRIVSGIIDTLQTLPSFVYLIPVVMLFRVGDFSAMIAVVLYAIAPAVRYAAQGVRSINPQLIEAGIVSGCTPFQLLRRIRVPLALPEILLGLNQTIMLALSMLVITALVGTRDLGQEVYIALTKADTGRGLVAGLAIAFIAILADRFVAAGANRAKQRYGYES
ncbi:ABC transporter permease [Sneathiella glossodoripedis]|uniref:ABC transporter permease n=1 Tax=Sneathiella glossodoripedis TaxID=418853 RepID=UPI000472AA30|nr:ABC transporter permease subunit [Sneathiella glossodoripedis]